MVSTATRCPILKQIRYKEEETASYCLLMWSLVLTGEKHCFLLRLFPGPLLHSLQPSAPDSLPPAPLYRLKGLNGGNLISHVSECTRWLTCLWQTFRDLSWCHVEWHMLTSALFSSLLISCMYSPSVYLEVRQSTKPGKIRGEDGRHFLQPALFSSSAVSNITWHDHHSVFRCTAHSHCFNFSVKLRSYSWLLLTLFYVYLFWYLNNL